MIDLKNKVVVITGATSGLGACLAEDFVNKGSKVVSLSQKDAEINNPQIEYVKCDITDREKVFNEVKNIEEKFGSIDILVNNAGVWMSHVSVADETQERIQNMINVNLYGTVFCIQAVLPIFRNKNNGIFLNTISTSALEGHPYSSGYAASKCAQNGFTKSLREELRDTKIKVINSYPGGMKTHLFDDKKPDNYDEYMEPSEVSQKIIKFLEEEEGEEIIIRRD